MRISRRATTSWSSSNAGASAGGVFQKVQSASAVAAGLPANDDFNGARADGFGVYELTQRKGRRHSAWRAFLHPVRQRGNLTVLSGALALQVVVDGAARRATGVRVDGGGQVREVGANREVLLCGGAINSPQLLALSGIGPADHLRDVGVEPVVDVPGVGKNLQDHLATLVHYSRPNAGKFRDLMRFDRMAIAMLQAYIFKSGPATVLPGGPLLKI